MGFQFEQFFPISTDPESIQVETEILSKREEIWGNILFQLRNIQLFQKVRKKPAPTTEESLIYPSGLDVKKPYNRVQALYDYIASLEDPHFAK